MFPTFQRAMQRRTSTVAGVELGPLTLAQAYCLCAWESPFLKGGDITLPDFAVAIWTCTDSCYPFEQFTKAVCAGAPDRMLKRLGKGYDLRQFNPDVEALKEHITWHCQAPPRFIKGQKTNRGPCAPWPMTIAVQVIPLLGTETTWTSPVPLAMAYKIALDNASGDTSWKSEEEQARGYANAGDTQSDQ